MVGGFLAFPGFAFFERAGIALLEAFEGVGCGATFGKRSFVRGCR